jgi:hypothetical protein
VYLLNFIGNYFLMLLSKSYKYLSRAHAMRPYSQSKKKRYYLIWIGAIATILFLQQGINAQERDRDSRCQSPLNSRCEGYKPRSEPENQILKVRLEISGPDDEWIRIEMSDRTEGGTSVMAYHTKRIRKELLSNVVTRIAEFSARSLAREAIDGYGGPVPIPDINFHRWADHETRRIFFVPDGCLDRTPVLPGNSQPSCLIAGDDTIVLPEGMDFQAGVFTIEYAEKDLIRSIAFRIPSKDS